MYNADENNNTHYHSGILFLKPTDVHFERAVEILNNRHQVLLRVYEKNPARFNHKIPALKKLKPAYINPPKIESERNNEEINLQKGRIMA
ncbi:MAG: hypothetical protein Q8L78_05795 [Coxiellaceae bacterium]|nr:hypothetical protein [Coxiellaceae bacterium]